jgi:sortase A
MLETFFDLETHPARFRRNRFGASKRVLEQALGLIAVAAITYCTWGFVDARLYQALEERRFEELFEQHLAALSAPHPAPPSSAAGRRQGIAPQAPQPSPRPQVILRNSEIIGRIEIPRLGLAAMVAEGTDSRTLRRAVGHVPGTALPGQRGNVALAGHRDAFFRGLGQVRPGDQVRLRTESGVYVYEVGYSRIVGPEQTDVLDSSNSPMLTLITCYPFGWVGPAPQRFIVSARQVATPGAERSATLR